MSIERQKQRLKEKANVDKRLKEYQKQPVSLISTQEMSISHSFTPTLEGKPTPTQMSIVKLSESQYLSWGSWSLCLPAILTSPCSSDSTS